MTNDKAHKVELLIKPNDSMDVINISLEKGKEDKILPVRNKENYKDIRIDTYEKVNISDLRERTFRNFFFEEEILSNSPNVLNTSKSTNKIKMTRKAESQKELGHAFSMRPDFNKKLSLSQPDMNAIKNK